MLITTPSGKRASKDEKLTLGNLAKYHLRQFKKPRPGPRFIEEGLISKEPYLRPMNESFSRFIMSEASPESSWRAARRRGRQ